LLEKNAIWILEGRGKYFPIEGRNVIPLRGRHLTDSAQFHLMIADQTTVEFFMDTVLLDRIAAPATAGSAFESGADAPQELIAFSGVSKVYPSRNADGGVTALAAVSLSIPKGVIYGIIGRSGAGKSTLLRLVNGLEKPTSGSVVVDGVDVSVLGERELRAVRRRAGMIFQSFNLLSSRTAFGNVALPLELAGAKKQAIAARVGNLLDLVGLSEKSNRYPAELSGGQKQRVGIARALATEPAVLLSDEATSALDPETTRSILDLLRRVNEVTKVTIVLITHEMNVIKSICDRVAVIDHGRIIEEGGVYEVLAQPKSAITKRFVTEVTGHHLPDSLAKELSSTCGDRSRAVVRIVFTGEHATAPILSRLSRTLDIDVTILAGQVDQIGSAPFGNLIVAIPREQMYCTQQKRSCVPTG
jgi:D-methionine transport system ATP-binding protein